VNALRGVFLRVASRTVARAATVSVASSRGAHFRPMEVGAGQPDFRSISRLWASRSRARFH
jgi:hypothetical protein